MNVRLFTFIRRVLLAGMITFVVFRPATVVAEENTATAFSCNQVGADIIINFHSNKVPSAVDITTPSGKHFFIDDLMGRFKGVRLTSRGHDLIMAIDVENFRGKKPREDGGDKIFAAAGKYYFSFKESPRIAYESPYELNCKLTLDNQARRKL